MSTYTNIYDAEYRPLLEFWGAESLEYALGASYFEALHEAPPASLDELWLDKLTSAQDT